MPVLFDNNTIGFWGLTSLVYLSRGSFQELNGFIEQAAGFRRFCAFSNDGELTSELLQIFCNANQGSNKSRI